MKVKIYKSGGEVQTPPDFNQNKNEQAKNTKAYSFLAREYGERYRLLNVENKYKVKNPDALNLKTYQFSDAKVPTTENGKNAIQNSIKEASKQNVAEAYIYLERKYKMQDIWAGLKAALQGGRARTIETVIIKLEDNELKRYEIKKIRKIFNK